MSSSDESGLIANQEWDDAYFSLIIELRTKNSHRYLEQTEVLLHKKNIELELSGYSVKYTLDRTGCWFDATNSDKGIGLGLGNNIKCITTAKPHIMMPH